MEFSFKVVPGNLLTVSWFFNVIICKAISYNFLTLVGVGFRSGTLKKSEMSPDQCSKLTLYAWYDMKNDQRWTIFRFKILIYKNLNKILNKKNLSFFNKCYTFSSDCLAGSPGGLSSMMRDWLEATLLAASVLLLLQPASDRGRCINLATWTTKTWIVLAFL